MTGLSGINTLIPASNNLAESASELPVWIVRNRTFSNIYFSPKTEWVTANDISRSDVSMHIGYYINIIVLSQANTDKVIELL